jgi:hypothetical protein
MEAARQLREQHDLVPEQIARIRLSLDESCDRVCNIPAPRTGLDFHHGRLNTLADLELVLTDGRRVAASHDAGVPASDIDEQGGRLAEKFTSLAEPILGREKARDLLGEIGRIDALSDLHGLMRLCAA